MKYVLVICDGMSDYPVPELRGKTPLQIARKPNMDMIAGSGIYGLFKSIPDGMGCGTDIASLSILGYDVRSVYTGRAPIEASAMGINLSEGDLALRCNFIYAADGEVKDYSAGHISSEEGKELIAALNRQFGIPGEIEFYPGVSYRNILILRKKYSNKIHTTPPHDYPYMKIKENLIKYTEEEGRETAELLNNIILGSEELLTTHPINIQRKNAKKTPANLVWFWGEGTKPNLESFSSKYKLKGALISAVDIIKGIGKLIGMDVINVPGATGYYDTNYEGKAEYAIKALKKYDFVLIHIEAPDEAGHEGNVKEKIRAIENIDRYVIGKIINEMQKCKEECRIGVMADHPTPIIEKIHKGDPVPFAICDIKDIKNGKSKSFDEITAREGIYIKKGFMELFFSEIL